MAQSQASVTLLDVYSRERETSLFDNLHSWQRRLCFVIIIITTWPLLCHWHSHMNPRQVEFRGKVYCQTNNECIVDLLYCQGDPLSGTQKNTWFKKQDLLKKRKRKKGPTIPFWGGRLQNLPTPTGPNRPPLSPKPPFLS